MATPIVISHRTNMGTMPENTLAGVDQAILEGAAGVEIDVRATRDGEIVLLHDASLERTTGDPRDLADVTLEELSAVRVSPLHAYAEPQPVPTLAQTLERIDGRAILVIEIKQPGVEAAVARIVRAAGATERCWIWAFDPAVCVASRRELPEVPVALNVGPGSGERFGFDSYLEFAERERLAAVSLAHAMVDADEVARAHERGLAVYTWTVNEPADIERVRDASVDAICGDTAAGLRLVLER